MTDVVVVAGDAKFHVWFVGNYAWCVPLWYSLRPVRRVC